MQLIIEICVPIHVFALDPPPRIRITLPWDRCLKNKLTYGCLHIVVPYCARHPISYLPPRIFRPVGHTYITPHVSLSISQPRVARLQSLQLFSSNASNITASMITLARNTRILGRAAGAEAQNSTMEYSELIAKARNG